MMGEPRIRKIIILDENGTVINSANPLPVDATLTVGDIEIGAVEIKNATTDDRLIVNTDGTANYRIHNAVGAIDVSNPLAIIPGSDYTLTVGGQKAFVVAIPHNISIDDISAGTQTNDIKITLDSEVVTVNATDLDIRNLTTATDSVKATNNVLTHNGAKDSDYKISLTANTATQIPEAANLPAYDYVLILSNVSDTEMRHGSSTGIVVAGVIDKGIVLPASTGVANFRFKANESLYVACSGASKQLNYTIKSIEEAT